MILPSVEDGPGWGWLAGAVHSLASGTWTRNHSIDVEWQEIDADQCVSDADQSVRCAATLTYLSSNLGTWLANNGVGDLRALVRNPTPHSQHIRLERRCSFRQDGIR